MRLSHTDEPLWFGREFTACELLHHIAVHHLERYNRIDPHTMPCWELGVVETGSMDLLLDDRPLHVAAGRMAVIAPGVRIRSGEGRNAGRFYWIGINAEPTTHEASHPWLSRRVGQLGRLLAMREGSTPLAREGLIGRARELVALCLDSSSDPFARAGVSLSLVARAATALERTGSSVSSSEASALEPALERVRTSLHERPSVDELARACGMPRGTFCDQFRRCIGQTPAQYVRQQQIERVAGLLRTTDRSVTRIAHELGFSSSQYLSAVFRRFVGQSPTEYRRACESGAATDSNDTPSGVRYTEDRQEPHGESH